MDQGDTHQYLGRRLGQVARVDIHFRYIRSDNCQVCWNIVELERKHWSLDTHRYQSNWTFSFESQPGTDSRSHCLCLYKSGPLDICACQLNTELLYGKKQNYRLIQPMERLLTEVRVRLLKFSSTR